MFPISKIIDLRNAILHMYIAAMAAKEMSAFMGDNQSALMYQIREQTLADVLNIADNAY